MPPPRSITAESGTRVELLGVEAGHPSPIVVGHLAFPRVRWTLSRAIEVLLFTTALVVASFLTALVSGLLLGFLFVVMPGIGTLDDRGFLRAFQVIDRVIQNSQPAFVLVWGGSIVSVVAASFLTISGADGSVRVLVLAGTFVYLLGVQLPTFLVNIPLNNELQSHDFDSMDEGELASARSAFEPRWNRWNAIRTFLACLASLVLILSLVRL